MEAEAKTMLKLAFVTEKISKKTARRVALARGKMDGSLTSKVHESARPRRTPRD